MSITERKHVPEPGTVHRLEIFTGAGRGRTWPAEVRARIAAESLALGATACGVARRHGLSPQQLSAWRGAAPRGRGRGGAAVLRAGPAGADPGRGVPAEPRAGGGGRDRGRGRGGPGRARRRRADPGRAAAGGEGLDVILPPAPFRVLVATRPVDFRKGIDGLAAPVRERLGKEPFSGVVYVFRAERADRVKLLFWDGTGAVVLSSRHLCK